MLRQIHTSTNGSYFWLTTFDFIQSIYQPYQHSNFVCSGYNYDLQLCVTLWYTDFYFSFEVWILFDHFAFCLLQQNWTFNSGPASEGCVAHSSIRVCADICIESPEGVYKFIKLSELKSQTFWLCYLKCHTRTLIRSEMIPIQSPR